VSESWIQGHSCILYMVAPFLARVARCNLPANEHAHEREKSRAMVYFKSAVVGTIVGIGSRGRRSRRGSLSSEVQAHTDLPKGSSLRP